MATKNREYNVMVKIVLETAIPISAGSFEDALEKATAYEVRDVVDFDTDFNDGSISILGVYKLGE